MKIVDTFIAPVCEDQIRLLFQDEHLLLINKPSGLLSLSGKNPLNKDSVHSRLVQDFPTARLVHRLDFGTSGIMVVALSKAVNAHLGKQFQAGEVAKTYTALLAGHLAEESGVLDFPIAKDPALFPRQTICWTQGKSARTEYQVLARQWAPCATRVLFRPITGRTHQLRIHSQAIGHSIIGCDLYASRAVQQLAPRLLLHATTLAFIHPVSGEPISHYCECPF